MMLQQLRAFKACMRQQISVNPKKRQIAIEACRSPPRDRKWFGFALTVDYNLQSVSCRRLPTPASGYLASGMYDQQLAFWRSRFPPESLCIVSSDYFTEHGQEVC